MLYFEESIFGHCKATMVDKILGTQFYLHYFKGDTKAKETS